MVSLLSAVHKLSDSPRAKLNASGYKEVSKEARSSREIGITHPSSMEEAGVSDIKLRTVRRTHGGC